MSVEALFDVDAARPPVMKDAEELAREEALLAEAQAHAHKVSSMRWCRKRMSLSGVSTQISMPCFYHNAPVIRSTGASQPC